ncbi:MAG: PQQ-binding-like beta-propeller repeat protein [Caldisericia bacterium]
MILVSVFTFPLVGTDVVEAENRHGDPGNAGRVNFVGSDPMTAHWAVDIRPVTTSNRISSSNGRETLVISGVKTIDCLDIETGKSIWPSALETPSIITGTPSITDDMGVVTCANGFIVAYDLKRGCELFSLSTKWDQFSSPVVGENFIFVKAIENNDNSGSILAISPVTGKIVKTVPCCPVFHPPTVGSEKLFVPLETEGEFVALDELSLNFIWDAKINSEIDFISTRFGRVCVVSSNIVYLFNAENGEFLWKRPIHGCYEISWSPTISAELVFLCSKNAKRVTALDLETGEIMWEKFLESSTYQPLVDKTRIILTLERCVEVRDQKTGEFLWEIPTVGSTVGNATAVSDNMFIATSLSKLVSLKTAGYEIKSSVNSFDLGEVTIAEKFTQSSEILISNCSIQEIDVTFDSKVDWLSVSPENIKMAGGQEVNLLIIADLENLDIGEYSSEIVVNWDHGSLTIPVNVSKIVEPKPVLTPAFFQIDTNEISKSGALNHPLESCLLTIRNTGETPGKIDIYSEQDWILLSKRELEIPSGSFGRIGITFIPGLAEHGKNTGKITLKSDTGQVLTIDVEFVRNPGTKRVIIEVKSERDWIKINNVRFRARPAPVIRNGELLIPLNLVNLILDSEVIRWKGNPDAPCKTAYNQIVRGDIVVGNCEGSDILNIKNNNRDDSIQMNSSSEVIDESLLIPIEPVLKAFDEKLFKERAS